MSTPLGEFTAAVCELHLGAGSPTPDQIRRRIRGDHVPSADAIRAVLLGPALPPDIADVDAVVGVLWPSAVSRVHELWVRAAAQRPLGRPVESLSPGELGVHRALGGTLPTYVMREHDHKLRAVSSGIAVLVGGSSSGKTRACYEALQELAGWRVWPAVHPTDPQQLLAELPQVSPRTVVWLDEAQRYLLDPPAEVREAIVAGLRALLADETRGPVLILGTLWPRYWQELNRTPGDGEQDTARFLLDGNGILVPDTFSAADLATAAATGDPAMVEAAELAEDAAITQYLAGAPDLLQRYELADQAQKAVIHAAMDARRLGHGEWLPENFLRAAARAFLDNRTTRVLDRDPAWFDEALVELTRLGRADTSVLTPDSAGRHRLADYLDQYGLRTRLFDFPPQAFWAAVTDHVTDPTDLSRLGDNAFSRLRLRLATDLYRRAANDDGRTGLAKVADRLDDAGDQEGADRLVVELADVDGGAAITALVTTRWLHGKSDPVRDERLLRRAVDLGNLEAYPRLVPLRESAGDRQDAERLALQSAEQGDLTALADLAVDRDIADEADAEQLFRRLPPQLRVPVIVQVANARADGNYVAGAEELALVAADAGDWAAVRYLVEQLRKDGDHENAARLRGVLDDAGQPADEEAAPIDPDRLENRFLAMLEAGEIAAADELLRSADLDSPFDALMVLQLIRDLHDAGDSSRAEHWALELSNRSNSAGFGMLVMLKTRADDLSGAEQTAMWALEQGLPDILMMLADEFADRGDHAGARRCAQRAADHGDRHAMVMTAEYQEHDGNHGEAEELARRAAVQGNAAGLVALASSRLQRAEPAEAELFAMQAVNMTDPDSGFSGGNGGPWPVLAEVRKSQNLLATGLAADGSPESTPSYHW